MNNMSNEEIIEVEDGNEEVYELAGHLKRLINNLVDAVMINFLTMGFIEVLVYTHNIERPKEGDLTLYLYILPMYLLYYIVMEGTLGRTVGKYLTNSTVVDEDGYKPSFVKILIRSICRLIPLEALSFLVSDAVGWHDKLSKTRVVVEVRK
jgi:uncharacterized RDD family membrane protein YckC